MKLKVLFCLALAGLSMFFIQSCSSEFISEEEGNTSSIEIENVDLAPLLTYCKYNITETETAKYPVNSIVCVTCVNPCPVLLTKKVKVGTATFTIKGRRQGSSCGNCPSNGAVI